MQPGYGYGLVASSFDHFPFARKTNGIRATEHAGEFVCGVTQQSAIVPSITCLGTYSPRWETILRYISPNVGNPSQESTTLMGVMRLWGMGEDRIGKSILRNPNDPPPPLVVPWYIANQFMNISALPSGSSMDRNIGNAVSL